MTSKSWKDLEKLTAKSLKGVRVLRGADFSKKDVDVKVPDFPNLQVDSKYRARNWAHHSYLAEIKAKYCNDEEDIAILVTKNHRQHGAVVSLDLEAFSSLLDAIRALRTR